MRALPATSRHEGTTAACIACVPALHASPLPLLLPRPACTPARPALSAPCCGCSSVEQPQRVGPAPCSAPAGLPRHTPVLCDPPRSLCSEADLTAGADPSVLSTGPNAGMAQAFRQLAALNGERGSRGGMLLAAGRCDACSTRRWLAITWPVLHGLRPSPPLQRASSATRSTTWRQSSTLSKTRSRQVLAARFGHRSCCLGRPLPAWGACAQWMAWGRWGEGGSGEGLKRGAVAVFLGAALRLGEGRRRVAGVTRLARRRA